MVWFCIEWQCKAYLEVSSHSHHVLGTVSLALSCRTLGLSLSPYTTFCLNGHVPPIHISLICANFYFQSKYVHTICLFEVNRRWSIPNSSTLWRPWIVYVLLFEIWKKKKKKKRFPLKSSDVKILCTVYHKDKQHGIMENISKGTIKSKEYWKKIK